VVAVESAVVRRLMLNPDGYLREGIDDWQGQRDSVLSSGALSILDSEWATLLPTYSTRRQGSIRLVAYGELL
jgi:hypothetical protein